MNARYTKPRAVGNCPVQIEGEIDGRRLYYFRARGRHAELDVGPLDDKSEFAAVGAAPFLDLTIASDYVAGWMPDTLAEQLAAWALDCWCHDNPAPTDSKTLNTTGDTTVTNEPAALEGHAATDALPAVVNTQEGEQGEWVASDAEPIESARQTHSKRADSRAVGTAADTSAPPPKPAYTVEISVGTCYWRLMIQELRRAVDHIEEHGEFSRCVWGGGGSHGHVHVWVRDVTEEAYMAELAAWVGHGGRLTDDAARGAQ